MSEKKSKVTGFNQIADRLYDIQRGKTISKADRKKVMDLLAESGKTISDADRDRVEELQKMLKRNDGGMAMKTRMF